jgi:hypothetical protein
VVHRIDHLKNVIMISDQNHTSDHGSNVRNNEKQKQVANEGSRAAHEKEATNEFESTKARESSTEDEGSGKESEKQHHSRDRKGREEWGGYKGF